MSERKKLMISMCPCRQGDVMLEVPGHLAELYRQSKGVLQEHCFVSMATYFLTVTTALDPLTV